MMLFLCKYSKPLAAPIATLILSSQVRGDLECSASIFVEVSLSYTLPRDNFMMEVD